ncbi:hypothetical protein HOLleu_21242 [Holothuria leucospilota]|uniref:Uncharacterized protein n=1 Tax=Holothuria leucospilota TaxID=206669 RepID=A0A9Q1BXJ3_HOLLE|nr:hypothetical protein HOLleu_21242 [Holothuria leucospilota]
MDHGSSDFENFNLIEDNFKLIQQNNELTARCNSLRLENENLKLEIMEYKKQLDDALCPSQKVPLLATGINVTPRKVKFMEELTKFVTSSLHGSSAGLSSSGPSLTGLSSSGPSSTSPVPSSAQSLTHCQSLLGLSSTGPSHSTALPTHETMETDDLVELVKGTGVYVTVQKRTSVILKAKKGPTFMFRKLLGDLFSQEKLRNGFAVGGRKTAVNKLAGGTQSIPLDSRKLDAAKGKTSTLRSIGFLKTDSHHPKVYF